MSGSVFDEPNWSQKLDKLFGEKDSPMPTNPQPTEQKAVELKPCPNPWCAESSPMPEQGGAHRDGFWWHVECDTCGLQSPLAHSRTEAIAAWNARPNAASVAEEWCTYMDEAVNNAPEPLRKLGEYLADLLDEDKWKTAEGLLNAAVLAARPLDTRVAGLVAEAKQALNDAKAARVEARNHLPGDMKVHYLGCERRVEERALNCLRRLIASFNEGGDTNAQD